MPSYQIRCINKNPREDRHHSITHVGGVDGNRWKITQADAISRIERGTDSFYTSVGGHHANVMVATHSGRKYLKTVNDRDTPDNLLSLPECP
jgi:hypothetical protein